MHVGEIQFEGKKSFDTFEEVSRFISQIGDKFIRAYQCKYPDGISFYIVEYETERSE